MVAINHGLLKQPDQTDAIEVRCNHDILGFFRKIVREETPTIERGDCLYRIERWIEASDLFTEALATKGSQSKVQVALRYCLSFPAVSVTIPGILTPQEVVENLQASGLGSLSASDLSEITHIYEKETFFVGKDA